MYRRKGAHLERSFDRSASFSASNTDVPRNSSVYIWSAAMPPGVREPRPRTRSEYTAASAPLASHTAIATASSVAEIAHVFSAHIATTRASATASVSSGLSRSSKKPPRGARAHPSS